MSSRKFFLPVSVLVLFFSFGSDPLDAGDWPTWRYNARRGASTPAALPAQLKLQWLRELPRQQTAWPASQTKLQFDRSYEPIVLGNRLFVGSTVNHGITAYNTESGKKLWTFFTDGPVRFAPAGSNGRLYAVSDDGYLYCLDAQSGNLIWKLNGGPADRLIIGNDRLVSSWSARGGPVVADGVVYFTAGIWPSMGIFIHAVDAQSGRILWTNSETGSEFIVHPHGAESFGSVVPQGYLAVSGDYLIVPGGRSLPAVLDRKTGKVVHFQFGGKSSGGYAVSAGADFFVAGRELFNLKTGSNLALANLSVISEDVAIGTQKEGGPILVHTLAGAVQQATVTNRKGKKETKQVYRPSAIRKIAVDQSASAKVWLRAGNRFYTGDNSRVAAFDLNTDGSAAIQKPTWTGRVNGTVGSMLAADDKLFVVTEEGRLYCFGKDEPAKPNIFLNRDSFRNHEKKSASASVAAGILDATDQSAGFCVALGLKDGNLIEQLVTQSDLYVVGVDADANKINQLRRRFDQAGLYGNRIALYAADPSRFYLPPYLAGLIVSENSSVLPVEDPSFLQRTFHSLRPYGGTISWQLSSDRHKTLSRTVSAASLLKVDLDRSGDSSYLKRVGALPGAGSWTHQYGSADNSVVSKDDLVKVPLGVLWFGGPSNDKILPRHGHGPSPQVAGGRLFIEGPDMLRAVDVYNGRLLWEKELKGLGEYYNTTRHFAGAGEIGSNYVSMPDSVYVIYDKKILELDAATGDAKKEFVFESGNQKETPHWGFIAVEGDYLIAASSPVEVNTKDVRGKKNAAVIPDGFEPLIKPKERWNYLAGNDPTANWTNVKYDDSDWKSGQAGFGYGDGDDRTVLENMQGHFTRVYLRRTFDGGAATLAEAMSLAVNFDDAFIAYLNGKEVARYNVNGGRGENVRFVGQHEAGGHELFSIRNFEKLLKAGTNVLAIEGHNRSIRSSDFTLDPFLLFKPNRNRTQKERTQEIVLAANEVAPEKKPENLGDAFNPVQYSSSSRQLAVFNRHSGKLLWKRVARYSFRHNGIAAAAGKVFCIDGLSPDKIQLFKRRGLDAAGKSRLFALDIRTGEERWSATENVTGTFLSYSDRFDVLLQAGSAFRDRAADEVGQGMVAYRGKDGTVLWQDLKIKYGGPCMLWRDKIITNGNGGFQLELLTGKPTGWTYSREYGCNTAIGSEHLLTFRSGAAGFCDISGDSGTGNIGGFRSSCTANLIAADGVLNAPDYTRTCVCAYQNQTSLALIHMPEADLWTFNDPKANVAATSIGLNLGAPGDRRGPNGTLWLEHPAIGGPSPEVKVTVAPKDVRWFRKHASQLQGEGLKWIAASGGEGIETVTLKLDAAAKSKSYTVRLHFAEPEDLKPGERVFSVSLQGEPVLSDFDISQTAGGTQRAVVREFKGVASTGEIVLELMRAEGSTRKPVLCGIEVLAE